MATKKLTKRVLDAVRPTDRDTFVWDTEVKGFGLKLTATGHRSFIFQYRKVGDSRRTAPRRVRLGDYGALTVDQARDLARQFAADVARGGNPAGDRVAGRSERRIDALFTDFLTSRSKSAVPATIAEYNRIFTREICPRFGAKQPRDVTRAEVAAWHNAMSDRPAIANRALDLFSAFFLWVEKMNAARISGEGNPCKGVDSFTLRPVTTVLTDDEYRALGVALTRAQTEGLPPAPALAAKSRGMSKTRRAKLTGRKRGAYIRHQPRVLVPANPVAVAALRFIALSGWRESEARTLRWDAIDWQRGLARLTHTKTGQSVRPLGPAALALLRMQPGAAESHQRSPFVFPGAVADHPIQDLRHTWAAAKDAAGVSLRLHDLRHSFVTIARDLDHGDHAIARVVGHVLNNTQTARYGAIRDQKAHDCAHETSAQIAALLGLPGANVGVDVLMFPARHVAAS